MAFTTVGSLAAMTPGKGVCVDVAGKKLAVFLVEGRALAIDEFCPHRNAPLHEGMCVGLEVVCPWHAARFDLTTGAHKNPPAKSGVKSYPTQIVGDDVQVDV
jgi:nitrite reductase/ring-hydroxylating ferredoxin subunit